MLSAVTEIFTAYVQVQSKNSEFSLEEGVGKTFMKKVTFHLIDSSPSSLFFFSRYVRDQGDTVKRWSLQIWKHSHDMRGS